MDKPETHKRNKMIEDLTHDQYIVNLLNRS